MTTARKEIIHTMGLTNVHFPTHTEQSALFAAGSWQRLIVAGDLPDGRRVWIVKNPLSGDYDAGFYFLCFSAPWLMAAAGKEPISMADYGYILTAPEFDQLMEIAGFILPADDIRPFANMAATDPDSARAWLAGALDHAGRDGALSGIDPDVLADCRAVGVIKNG